VKEITIIDLNDVDEPFNPGIIITYFGGEIESIEYTPEFEELDRETRDEIINAVFEEEEAPCAGEWVQIDH
jgi:hypothetical protein